MYKLIWRGEVVDEFSTIKEATDMLVEYNLAFGGGVTIKE